MRRECLDIFLLQLFGPEGVGAVVGDADVINRFAPRFTPAVARSRAHRRWKYAWSGVCASDARGAGRGI